jgi:hypothetical protein
MKSNKRCEPCSGSKAVLTVKGIYTKGGICTAVMLLVSSVAITCPWQRRLSYDIPLLIKQVKGIDLAKGAFLPQKAPFSAAPFSAVAHAPMGHH